MIKWSFWVAVLFSLACAAASAAQATVASAPVSLVDDDGERKRISSERAMAESLYQRDEAGCYARFAVTDCIQLLRRQRREVLDRLHKQDAAINDRDRQRKAQARLDSSREKSSNEKQAEGAVQRLEAQAARQARIDNAALKATAAAGAKPVQPRAAQAPQDQGRSAQDIAKTKQQYADKLEAAALHRAARLKSNGEKAGIPKKPLPQYP